MNKRQILTVALLAVLCIAIAAPVYASYTTSLMYTNFNSTSWTSYALDQDYTALTADVKVRLTYNVTGSWAKVAFMNDTGDTPMGILLAFSDDDSTVTVYYVNGATEVEIATGTYTDTVNATTTRLVLSGNKVSIYTNYGNRTSQQTILSSFSFNEPMSYLRVKGSDVNTASNGYVQVNVNTGASGISGSTTDTVMQFVPVIVTFTMLGMILGLLKKFGKI